MLRRDKRSAELLAQLVEWLPRRYPMFSEFLDRDFQYAFIEAIFGKSVETICHQTVDLTLAAIHSVLEPGRL